MAKRGKSEYVIDLLPELAEIERAQGRHRVADEIDDVAQRLREELYAAPRSVRPEAAPIANELDKLAARARKAGLLFEAKLIAMAALALRPPTSEPGTSSEKRA